MKRLVLVAAMGAFIAAGAFAEITLGVTGVQYYQEDSNGNLPGVDTAWKDFKDGTNVFWGGFAEIIGKHYGLGLSFNFMPSNNEYDSRLDMMAYDVNIYLSYHFFGGSSFLDPFLQAGIGMMAFNYTDPEAARQAYNPLYPYSYNNYVDQDDPQAASLYWDFGVGIGVNLGIVGVFTKVMFNNQIKGTLQGTYDDDAGSCGYPVGQKYDIPGFEPMPMKWVFGAKIII